MCILLCGCSHNGLLFINGKYFGLNAQGFTYASGIMITDLSRENSSFKASVKDEDGLSDEKSINGEIKVERSIGKQCTGYLVDLAKVSPETAAEYVKPEQK